MPSYDYACNRCGNVFTRKLKISERHNPTGTCEKCGGEVTIALSAPSFAYDSNLKTSDFFNDKMKQLKACTPARMHKLDKIIR